MARQRKSKRQQIRDEKRQRKRKHELAGGEKVHSAKRRRHEQAETDTNGWGEFVPLEEQQQPDGGVRGIDGSQGHRPNAAVEREFFGMLADEEQEYFRRADELLELNDFPSDEERTLLVQNVFSEARGKTLKLASSQSCSRLVERLVALAGVRELKALWGEFAGHFITLITHRFASHCCEKLFLRSAEAVGTDSEGASKEEGDAAADDAAQATTMEQLFLLMLDELEGHLQFLLTDRYASHTLRVLLVALSGRPLDSLATKSLLRSKKKENVTVMGAHASLAESNTQQNRPVPESFINAVKKIIVDSTASLDATTLRVLAQHPTGNPAMQLLLELDISLNVKASKSAKSGAVGDGIHEAAGTLLDKILPGAPSSLGDPKSPASEFVSGMIYDPIGSRLLEVLITHCPGKTFKGLYTHILGPRIDSLLRNETASYPAIKALNRLSKEDLAAAVEKALPLLAQLLDRGRFNVLQTLFKRCQIRGADSQLVELTGSLNAALASRRDSLVPTLCLDPPGSTSEQDPQAERFESDAKKQSRVSAMQAHGASLATALLKIPGAPSDAVQSSLVSLSQEQLVQLATSSKLTAGVVVTALSTPSTNMAFHKLLVATLTADVMALAKSVPGHRVLSGIADIPCKGAPGRGAGSVSVPLHMKESIMGRLAEHESELRESWTGREVWRAWRGDLCKNRRFEWGRWMKGTEPARN